MLSLSGCAVADLEQVNQKRMESPQRFSETWAAKNRRAKTPEFGYMKLHTHSDVKMVRKPPNQLLVQCARLAEGRFGSDIGLDTCLEASQQEGLTRGDYAKAYYHLSIIHAQLAEFDKSLAAADRALTHDPTLADAHFARAAVFVERHDFQAAETAIKDALAGEPEQPSYAYYLRGIIHDMNNEFVPAYQSYKRAVDMRPGWPPAKERLEFIKHATDVQRYLDAKGG